MSSESKIYRSIGLKSAMAWSKIAFGGLIFSVICFLAGIMILFNSPEKENGFALVIKTEPYADALIVMSCIFVFLYFALASKHALQTALYSLWKNKLSDFILPKTLTYIEHISNALQPEWLKDVTNKAMIKIKLLDEVRKDKSINRIQRKALNLGFRKLKLDDMDFQQDQPLASIICLKINNTIASVSRPSMFLFWLLIGLQVVMLILALVL